MRFQRPLDTILDSAAKVRVLRFFCLKGGEWSGRRVAAEVGVSPATAHHALRWLRRETLLDFRKVGSSFAYSLRDGHDFVREVLRPLFEREAQAQERLFSLLGARLIPKLGPRVVTAAVYGSVARGEERSASDIDLLILVKSERAKREVREAFGELWRAVVEQFGNSLTPYLCSVDEFRLKSRRKLALIQNILRAHRVVYGESLEKVLNGRAS